MDEPPQATWKRVRPVLLTTIVPVAAALGFFALATYANTKGDVRDLPSMAAYDACLTANDLQPAQSYATEFDRQIAAQQMMKVCGDKIPPEIIKKWENEAQAAAGRSESAWRTRRQTQPRVRPVPGPAVDRLPRRVRHVPRPASGQQRGRRRRDAARAEDDARAWPDRLTLLRCRP